MGADIALEFIDFAHCLADTARPLARHYYRQDIGTEVKGDKSPVTIADRAIEAQLRERIAEKYPDHGIWGEEEGAKDLDADYIWIIDPIDGTKSFMIGKPTFGTLIGLLYKGHPVIGIIDQPISEERWVGVSGRRTELNGLPITTRFHTQDISEAVLAATGPEYFDGYDEFEFKNLTKETRFTVYGGDCYIYGLLASGRLDLIAEGTLKPHDFFPLIPIIEGAGGTITDCHGDLLSFESDGTVLASANRIIHEQALEMIKSK